MKSLESLVPVDLCGAPQKPHGMSDSLPVILLQGYLTLSNALSYLCLWLFLRAATIKCNTKANTVNVLKRLTSINNCSVLSKQHFQSS